MHLPWHLLGLIFLTFNRISCAILTCYKCDSVSFPNCATNLDNEELPTEECNKNAFSCASSIVDSVTYRGCSTNTPRGPVYYKTCTENLCNKGVFPPGRLKCHQCSRTSGCANPLDKPRPCVNFVEDDNCYTDVIDEIDTYRGCDSDTGRIPSGSVLYCETNGCNNLPAVETLICSKCDSTDARGCKMDLFEINNANCVITNQTTCSALSLLGHEQPSCFLYQKLDHVVRGCTFDSGTLSLDPENFDICETNLCNKKCLKRQKCIACDSSTNDFCKSDPSSVTAGTCEGAEASSCYSCELNNGTVRRGCGLPPILTGAHCNQCQDEGCNGINFTKCYKCSSDDSPNCGQWANPNIIDVENCEMSGADCISTVLKNGKTLRGCESLQLKCNGTQSSCYSCSGSLCNEGVYPPMRLQCHHCDGRDKCSHIVDNSNLLPCAQYDENDACFEFLSGKGTMVRGCRSDNDMFYECLLASQNGNGCRLCSGPGCNMMPISRPPYLTCHHCSRENESCSWLQGNDTLKICQKVVHFLSLESCYTRRYLDGSTGRGCSLDENKIEESDEFLEHTCSDDGCNGKSQLVQKCIVCRGSIEENNNCISEAGSMDGTLCKNGSLEFGNRGCYTKFDDGFIQRDCASNLTSAELDRCQHDNDSNCYYCQGIECNSFSNLTFILNKNSSSKDWQPLVRLYFILLSIVIYLIL